MSTNLLAPNQCLVYIRNKFPFADADGYTYIAQKIKDYIIDDELWYDVLLLTEANGDKLNISTPVTVSGNNVLSNRIFHDISPRNIYQFATLPLSGNIQYSIQARGFVIKNNSSKEDNQIENTSRSALGSGIFGLYISNPQNIDKYKTNPNQQVFTISCPYAYPIQDKEHGDSITIASLQTNRYLDSIIRALKDGDFISYEIAHKFIKDNREDKLYTLWNIVFYRTNDFISRDKLDEILANYVVKYLTDRSLIDSLNGQPLQELPINDIMLSMGYDGIIAQDTYNNGWDRGCINYQYSQAAILQGETALY